VAHLLQLGIKAAFGLDVGMADMMPGLGRLSAMVAYLGHGYILRGGGIRSRRKCARQFALDNLYAYPLFGQMASP
jgi:hypothetical protein